MRLKALSLDKYTDAVRVMVAKPFPETSDFRKFLTGQSEDDMKTAVQIMKGKPGYKSRCDEIRAEIKRRNYTPVKDKNFSPTWKEWFSNQWDDTRYDVRRKMGYKIGGSDGQGENDTDCGSLWF